jgi:thymidine phosphorylase
MAKSYNFGEFNKDIKDLMKKFVRPMIKLSDAKHTQKQLNDAIENIFTNGSAADRYDIIKMFSGYFDGFLEIYEKQAEVEAWARADKVEVEDNKDA